MPSEADYIAEIERLRARLERAERTLEVGRGAAAAASSFSHAHQLQDDQLLGKTPSCGLHDEPFRVLVEQMHEGAVTLTNDGRITYCNRYFAALLRRDSTLLLGVALEEIVIPADRAACRALLREARSAGAKAEVTLDSGGGGPVPVYLSAGPFLVGNRPGICLVVTDLTQRKRNDAVVSAGKLARSILDHATEALLVCDPRCRVTHANHSAHRLCGTPLLDRPIGEALGTRLSWPMGEKHGIGSLDAALDSALAGQIVESIETRLWQSPDSARNLLFAAGPILDARHRVLGCVITLTDVTELKQSEDRLRHLAAELSHRVKNTIAIIQSIADQTLSRSRSIHTFGRAFQGRLRALAASHRLLMGNHWRSANLQTLLETILRGAVPSAAGHVTVDGPPVELTPRAAVSLGMALHELATNAAHHGALSRETGQVTISWWLEAPSSGGRLRLRWVERSGADVPPPSRGGFGTELIRRTVEYDLDGTVDLDYHANGLRCELAFWPNPEAPEAIAASLEEVGLPATAGVDGSDAPEADGKRQSLLAEVSASVRMDRTTAPSA